jgi:hypothetical protein
MEYTQEQLVQMAYMIEWMIKKSASIHQDGKNSYHIEMPDGHNYYGNGNYNSTSYTSPREALIGEMERDRNNLLPCGTQQ